MWTTPWTETKESAILARIFSYFTMGTNQALRGSNPRRVASLYTKCWKKTTGIVEMFLLVPLHNFNDSNLNVFLIFSFWKIIFTLNLMKQVSIKLKESYQWINIENVISRYMIYWDDICLYNLYWTYEGKWFGNG